MTGAATPDWEDPLRLTTCPNCQYSLEGLPAAGTCPECGIAYDDSFVVLQDDKGTDTEPASRRAWRWAWYAFLVIVLAFWLPSVVRRHDMFAAAFIAPTLVAMGVLGWYRLMSPTAPRMQLWMCAQGFQYVASTPEGRANVRKQQLIQVWGQAFAFVLVAVLCKFASAAFWSFIAMSVFSACLALAFHAAKRRTERIQGSKVDGPITRQLIPWTALDRCEWKQIRPDRLRLRFRHPLKMFGRLEYSKQWCALIETHLSPAKLVALRSRLREWEVGVTEK